MNHIENEPEDPDFEDNGEREEEDFDMEDLDDEPDFEDDAMDGDHESALASAGFGTDEDYGYWGGDE